ncbi:helix-turn-helix transcriptional regulator [Arsenophonus sp. PmNCSU2021_1]|uniref:helix-turn-helix transcriptional regulator n=1 Tax=Arsenophonus sp. PmNCSU2021_1 TaxID=3118989 RepID=UPI002FF0A68C
MLNDLIEEKEVLKKLKRSRSALWRLRKKCGFPEPVLNYPARYRLSAIQAWIERGGINQRACT